LNVKILTGGIWDELCPQGHFLGCFNQLLGDMSWITAAIHSVHLTSLLSCFVCRAAGLFFISAFFINLLAGIVFLLGANVAILCDGLSDYKLLQRVSSFFQSSTV